MPLDDVMRPEERPRRSRTARRCRVLCAPDGRFQLSGTVEGPPLHGRLGMRLLAYSLVHGRVRIIGRVNGHFGPRAALGCVSAPGCPLRVGPRPCRTRPPGPPDRSGYTPRFPGRCKAELLATALTFEVSLEAYPARAFLPGTDFAHGWR